MPARFLDWRRHGPVLFDRFRLDLFWGVLVLGVVVLLGAALLPPFLPVGWRAVLMEGFSSLCHQIPGRSPHLRGVPLAICDRCLGIYGGLLLGVLGVPVCWRWQRGLRGYATILLGTTGGLMGLDWIGPILGTWPNVPWSRLLTGAAFGVMVGLLAGQALMRAEKNAAAEGSPAGAGQRHD